MKELEKKEIYLVSAGNSSFLIDAMLVALGAYYGSSIAFIESLMTQTITYGPMGAVTTYAPNPFILFSGISVGAAMGFAIGFGLSSSSNPPSP